jgi:hypothetical protein
MDEGRDEQDDCLSCSRLGSGSGIDSAHPSRAHVETDSVVVGPPPRAPEGSAGRQTTGRDLLAGLSRSTLAASSSIAEPSGNPTAHDEQEPRQEEGEHRESQSEHDCRTIPCQE